MEKSFLFQNYDYVKNPVNFKHVVIDLLRSYGIFIHMRDAQSGIYDLDKFLYEKNSMGIPYHKENIVRLEKRLKEAEDKISQLNTDGDKLYQEYYDEGLKDYNDIIKGNKYYKEYKNEANKYLKRVHNIQDFLENFKLENQDYYNLIKDTLAGCIEALLGDYNYYNRLAINNDVGDNPALFSPMPKEMWIQEQIEECNDDIEFCIKEIKEEKLAIKLYIEKDKLIKEIFKALEPFDKEIE